MPSPTPRQPDASAAPGLAELFTPKLWTVLREGYRLTEFSRDAMAGLTVAIVALPLSMAIAIASGVSPAQGLYTAIIGGFVVSLLGGSRFQIGGPAGAFIVLVAATVQMHGVQGLILATALSGLMLMLAGALRLGSYIKFIPYPVTVGFTAGIAVIILGSQISELLGLTLPGPEPGPLIDKLPVLWQALPTASAAAFGVAITTILVIIVLRRFRPRWPGLLIAVVLATLISWLLKLPIDSIDSRFGGIPAGMPLPSLPEVSLAQIVAVLPNALAFALLGAIESLLSAVVADGMTGRRHRSNCELVAQGSANVASSLFGGFCVTGAIARTATNIRAGAHGPVAGMLHALFLLLFLLLAAPLAGPIPLAALAGVLVVVAWNMIERHAIAVLLRVSRGEATVLAVTFLLTVFRDLTEAILVGVALGALLFIHRMSQTIAIETGTGLIVEDAADGQADATGKETAEPNAIPADVVIYRISGAFFFGAASTVGSVLERIGNDYSTMIVDLSEVPMIDSTAANTLEILARKTRQRGIRLILTGTPKPLRRQLIALGLRPPLVRFKASIASALRSHAASAAEAADEKA